MASLIPLVSSEGNKAEESKECKRHADYLNNNFEGDAEQIKAYNRYMDWICDKLASDFYCYYFPPGFLMPPEMWAKLRERKDVTKVVLDVTSSEEVLLD